MKQKNIQKIVAAVIADVKKNGDRALVRLTRKYDRVTLTPRSLRISEARIKKAPDLISKANLSALKECARRIQNFHREEKKRLPTSWVVNRNGVKLGQVVRPIQSVGVYVPGGRFSYPSTLLMTAIPARLAGVSRIVVVTPPARLTNEILAAAAVAGVKEIYQVGGPGALAALAFGTAAVPKVDLIVGPGNALVTEAKRQLFGIIGIDLLAGPSELVVVADRSAKPEFVAADMAAQAEHDPDASGVLISFSRNLVSAVKKLIPQEIKSRCKFYYFSDVDKGHRKADEVAGEHVEIMTKNPFQTLASLRNGGTFFLNQFSPAVMGDYWAGPSHVLPTGRSARFGSGLSVMTFLRRSGLVEVSKPAFKKGWTSAHKMAEMEGLSQHAQSLFIRTKGAL